MKGFWIVFLGGGIGSACRHGINVLTAQFIGTRYPVGTFSINVVGSFAIGVVAGYLTLRSDLPSTARLFLVTGILGGFTTFSAFSLETGLLVERGELAIALLYVVASVALSIAAMFGGLHLVRNLG